MVQYSIWSHNDHIVTIEIDLDIYLDLNGIKSFKDIISSEITNIRGSNNINKINLNGLNKNNIWIYQ